MTDNTRYFVKSHFNGWSEVGFENYRRFVEIIMKNASGLKSSEKEKYIKKVTVSFSIDEFQGKSEEEIKKMIDDKLAKEQRKSFFDYLTSLGGNDNENG